MHLPVTALDTVIVDARRILIVGQGPWVRVYDCDTSRRLATTRIFDAQPVHQISHRPLVDDEGCLIVAGGRHVAVVSLRRGKGDTSTVVIRVVSRRLLPAQEWALKTSYHHDSFLLLTTNNHLYRLRTGSVPEKDTAVELLVKGPGSFLYSGDVKSVEPNRILVAAGSVFGEVLIWECRCEGDEPSTGWTMSTTHRLEGHTGSVFGVSISDVFLWKGRPSRFVASCSDDRTSKIWDVSEPLHGAVFSGEHETKMIDTGFGGKGQSNACCVASGHGHQSRIWDVRFIDESKQTDHESLKLLTRGEDGTCQLWLADLRKSRATDAALLSPLCSDRHHCGKNLWSWAGFSTGNKYTLFSGGADGRVVSRDLALIEEDVDKSFLYRQPFIDMPFEWNAQSLKEYVVVEDGSILALTNVGHVVRCRKLHKKSIEWEMLLDNTTLRATRLCSNLPPEVLIATCSKTIFVRFNGRFEDTIDLFGHFKQPVAQIHLAGQRREKTTDGVQFWLVATSMSGEACMVRFDSNQTTASHVVGRLRLPEHFSVMSSCYNYESDVLVLGSRAGALALYSEPSIDNLDSLQPLCGRHLHGTESVTSLQFLEYKSFEPNMRHILSTGRDGRYVIHRLLRHAVTADLSLTTVHSASPPFGPYIEGATVEQTSTGQQLILYGFRSKDFVVWNETLQLDVFSTDCGGAHRNWAFRHCGDGNMGADTFVWTKASTLNVYVQKAITHRIIQPGGHGREIKALACCPISYTDANRGLHNSFVIATGAEDTTVRIFAITDDENEHQLVQLSVLNEHTAGLQDLAFTSCGNYLFSCGGAEELFVWRVVYDVPLVGIGITLLDRLPHNDGDSDVRIMGLSVRSPKNEAMPGTFHVAAAYSNGKVKLLRYTPALTGSVDAWSLDQDMLFGTFCLMHVLVLSQKSTTIKSPAQLVLSAGTNGYLNAHSIVGSVSDKSAMTAYRIHQSSILALDILELSQDEFFVATGGDDNALGLTIIHGTHRVVSEATEQQAVTIRVSDAHAAALTSLRIFKSQKIADERIVHLITAGNDQRVHFWQITLPLHIARADQLQVIKLGSQWTDVADVSCVEVFDTRLVVTGVGIQVLNLEFGVDCMNLQTPHTAAGDPMIQIDSCC